MTLIVVISVMYLRLLLLTEMEGQCGTRQFSSWPHLPYKNKTEKHHHRLKVHFAFHTTTILKTLKTAWMFFFFLNLCHKTLSLAYKAEQLSVAMRDRPSCVWVQERLRTAQAKFFVFSATHEESCSSFLCLFTGLVQGLCICVCVCMHACEHHTFIHTSNMTNDSKASRGRKDTKNLPNHNHAAKTIFV